jgi:hypothetical protein
VRLGGASQARERGVAGRRRDRIIPVQHAEAAHADIKGSRLEVFADAGHFPYLDNPFRFVSVLTDFMRATKPADVDAVTVADEIRDRAKPRVKPTKLRAA